MLLTTFSNNFNFINFMFGEAQFIFILFEIIFGFSFAILLVRPCASKNRSHVLPSAGPTLSS